MSEFDLIRRLIEETPGLRSDVVVGPGDDAAVLTVPAGLELVLTTDTLIAGRHFPVDTHADDVGHKALAASLSDLAAMAAEPAWVTVALTMPDADETWLSGFVAGLSGLLAESGASLVGGDLTRGPLAVTVQAAGLVPAGCALRRDGARPGDAVCVTGDLGDAALGLSLWRSGERPRDAQLAYLHDRLVRPQPRNAAAGVVRDRAHAGVDISDGLVADLGHMLAAGGVGARLEADRLPCSAAFAAHCPAARRLDYQLAGGDDYELCVCLPPADVPALTEELAQGADCKFTVIGSIEARPGLRIVDAGGEPVAVRGGYDHFGPVHG